MRPSGTAGAPAGARVTLAELAWLIGTWRGTGQEDGSEIFQSYGVRDDSTVSIVYLNDATCTPADPVSGTLEQRGGRVYQTFGPSRWVMRGSPASLLLEPVGDAGTRFRWTPEGPTRWTATVIQPGSESTLTYTFQRLEPDPAAAARPCVPGAASDSPSRIRRRSP